MKKHLSIRVSDDLKERLRAKAKEGDMTMSKFAARAIEAYLQKLEQQIAEDAAKVEEFMRGYEND